MSPIWRTTIFSHTKQKGQSTNLSCFHYSPSTHGAQASSSSAVSPSISPSESPSGVASVGFNAIGWKRNAFPRPGAQHTAKQSQKDWCIKLFCMHRPGAAVRYSSLDITLCALDYTSKAQEGSNYASCTLSHAFVFLLWPDVAYFIVFLLVDFELYHWLVMPVFLEYAVQWQCQGRQVLLLFEQKSKPKLCQLWPIWIWARSVHAC